MRSWRVASLVCGAAALLGGVGCGAGGAEVTARSPYNQPVRTIGVPIFDNRSFSPDVGQDLTEAVIAEIQRRTPWRVVDPARAESRLAGTITSVELGSFSTTRGFVEEQSVRVVMDFRWENSLTGEVLVSQANFSALATFVPASPTGERIDRGLRSATNELAVRIVDAMTGDW